MQTRMEKYLTTFRRAPDAMVRSVAYRTIVPHDGGSCYVATLARAVVAERTRRSPDDSFSFAPQQQCMQAFGGDTDEWHAVWTAFLDGDGGADAATAWAQRMAEAGVGSAAGTIAGSIAAIWATRTAVGGVAGTPAMRPRRSTWRSTWRTRAGRALRAIALLIG